MLRRRVVVTGLGCVSPVGNSASESWSSLLAGKSGIDNITQFDAANFSVRFAGEVKGFNIGDYIPEKEARHMDRFIHLGLAAACQAVADSGLPTGDALKSELAERIGCNIGAGIGGLPMIEQTHTELMNRGPRRVSPFFVPASIINMISGHVSIKFGFKGPNIAVVTACTTGLHAIGLSARLIESGDADVMVAGGAESSVSPLGIGGFASARALSTRNDDPERASRPFDKDRDGFVVGEGSGVLILEEYERAVRRGARIYAELVGYGMSADAYHITAPSEDGDGPFRVMGAAMASAGIAPADVDYVNAHGTSTPHGDRVETIAIKRCFGEHAKKLAVSSTKSMTGHLLGAAGGLEAGISVLAVYHQVAPPTINLDVADEECDLDYIPNVKREMKIDYALSNSFGFGGTNAALLFKRFIA